MFLWSGKRRASPVTSPPEATARDRRALDARIENATELSEKHRDTASSSSPASTSSTRASLVNRRLCSAEDAIDRAFAIAP
jgi:hypothetical protein